MRAEIISAADGTALSARTYEPDSPDHGSVVIGGAMSVRQDYYAPFAQWLAGRGWRVTTFDYRGSGDSGPSGSALRGFKADLFDWGARLRSCDRPLRAFPQRARGQSLAAHGIVAGRAGRASRRLSGRIGRS